MSAEAEGRVSRMTCADVHQWAVSIGLAAEVADQLTALKFDGESLLELMSVADSCKLLMEAGVPLGAALKLMRNVKALLK